MSTPSEPTLRVGPVPLASDAVRDVVFVLHGGKVTSRAPSRPWHLSALRMWPFTWALRRATRGRGVVVAQLQYRCRGWNGAERSPVADAYRALQWLERDFPRARVIVVGHSMGGRTAAAVADAPVVSGVVALAPWWPDGGELDAVRSEQIIRVLHGASDTWTDPRKSAREVRAAAQRGVDAEFHEMTDGHFMIRQALVWTRLTTRFVIEMIERSRCDEDEVTS